ncbi:MAG: hypothetical protein QNJ73_02825 [Gammaproteobacteria bacterium]|nr:hypothetical protein [Gammaproteobacteria bacterium]
MGMRILGGFIVAFLLSSNLNWAIAEFVLNPWAMPRFDGFMRSGDDGAAGINILKMTAGFALSQLVVCSLMLMLDKPVGWLSRALVVTGLVCLAGFFGTYTFLSGWGDVNWVPLMGAAIADTVCIGVGAVVFGWIVLRKQEPGEILL